MKLSIKFFCIAYIIVLLTTSLSGIWLITSSKSSLINTKSEQTVSAAKYVADSIISFGETSTDEISKKQLSRLERQIKNAFTDTVSSVKILTPYEAEKNNIRLDAANGYSSFKKENSALIMQAVLRIDTLDSTYYTVVSSDFSGIENHYNKLWVIYGVTTFFFAVVGGILLYIFTKKITNPIYKFSKAANYIAEGNYGETINIKSKDTEIIELSHSFNQMSVKIKDNINEIENELKKRDMFVSSFTHEIKTPMTSIIGYSQMLNSYKLDEKEKAQAISSIHSESTRLEKLAMQLLNLYIYKNEDINLEKVDLKALSQQIENALTPLSKNTNVKIKITFDDCIVFANKVLLLSLIYNLVDNAIKASVSGSTVYIYSLRAKNNVTIYLKDNGRGINPQNIKYLTEPFFREDKARSRALGGAGLGLSLCEKIAELHGTTLAFESEINKGTTVCFTLKTEVKANV